MLSSAMPLRLRRLSASQAAAPKCDGQQPNIQTAQPVDHRFRMDRRRETIGAAKIRRLLLVLCNQAHGRGEQREEQTPRLICDTTNLTELEIDEAGNSHALCRLPASP